MSKYIIEGGRPLFGEIEVQGAKNAVLPIFAACVLTKEEVTVKNVPDLADVKSMENILNNLGVTVKKEGDTRVLCAKNADFDYMRKHGGSAVSYAWFCWRKSDYNQTTLDWI